MVDTGFKAVLRYACSLAAALGFWAAATCAGAGDAPDAQPFLDRYDAAMRDAANAWQQGDAAGARRHRGAAAKALEEAILVFDAAGAAASTDSEVLKTYAALRHLAGDYDLAAEALERAVAMTPDNPALWVELGRNLARTGPGKRQDAFDALRRALESAPGAPEAAAAHHELGALYFEEGLIEFAKEHYAQAQELAPGNVRVGLALAALTARDGDVAGAWSQIRDLGAAVMEHDVELRTLLGMALDDFDELRRSFPDTAENHAAYARLLYQAARIPEAVTAAHRATVLNPSDADTWKFLGDVQGQLGNLPQARAAYEKSLEVNPDQPLVRQRLERLQQSLQGQQ